MTIKNLSSHIGCNKTDKKSLKIPKGVIEEEQTYNGQKKKDLLSI
jgi:hypothetical protein